MRIAVVHPSANFASVPCLMSMVTLLAENGYTIDVFTRQDSAHETLAFGNGRIQVFPLENLSPVYRNRYERFVLKPLQRWAMRHQSAQYLCVVGVDPKGLVRAESFARRVGSPYAYLSLELMLSYELEENDKPLKAQELTYSRQAAFVIIQDETRGQLLIQDNGLDPENIVCLPNSPLGCATTTRSSYLRDRFDLDPEKKIILHCGSIGAWAGTHQLVDSTRDWPDEWVLICHTRYRALKANPDYLEALRYIERSGRVIYSVDPVPADEYPELVRSADIGVAFYCPVQGNRYTQDNIRYVGLSSGKLAYYLQAGIPVLVNDNPSIQPLVQRYQFGQVAQDPAITRDPIMAILADYETYSTKANDCFNDAFNFAEAFGELLRKLRALQTVDLRSITVPS